MNMIHSTILLLVSIFLPLSSSCVKANVSAKEEQKKPEVISSDNPLEGKKLVVIGNSMIYYGGLVQNGSQCGADYGMLKTLIQANGVKATVVDCTFGGHHLLDFTAAGCKCEDKNCYGTDHLKSLDFASFDYVIISEAGNNYSSFYSDAKALFQRFKDANKNAKLVYINHIYSVYKKHSNVLDNLKNLHDSLGVTIVNVGQLGYDIYTGAVKVPGGSLKYSDRYTFCNHTSSDTYHPNPLMGYMMTQMLYCALTGTKAAGTAYDKLIKNSYFAGGSVSYSDYYNKYYTTAAALPFMTVIDNAVEMSGIQQLIPLYIDKY